MAEESIHKQEFVVRNLQTRSVTLYPTRAQIVRDIKEIALKVCRFLFSYRPKLTASSTAWCKRDNHLGFHAYS